MKGDRRKAPSILQLYRTPCTVLRSSRLNLVRSQGEDISKQELKGLKSTRIIQTHSLWKFKTLFVGFSVYSLMSWNRLHGRQSRNSIYMISVFCPSLCGSDSHFFKLEWGCKLVLAVAFLPVFISAVNWEIICECQTKKYFIKINLTAQFSQKQIEKTSSQPHNLIQTSIISKTSYSNNCYFPNMSHKTQLSAAKQPSSCSVYCNGHHTPSPLLVRSRVLWSTSPVQISQGCQQQHHAS